MYKLEGDLHPLSLSLSQEINRRKKQGKCVRELHMVENIMHVVKNNKLLAMYQNKNNNKITDKNNSKNLNK